MAFKILEDGTILVGRLEEPKKVEPPKEEKPVEVKKPKGKK